MIMLLLTEITSPSTSQFLSGIAFGAAMLAVWDHIIREYRAVKKRRQERYEELSVEFVEFLWPENDKRS